MGQKPVNDAKRKVNSLKDKIKLKDEEQLALISSTPEEIRKNAYDGVKINYKKLIVK